MVEPTRTLVFVGSSGLRTARLYYESSFAQDISRYVWECWCRTVLLPKLVLTDNGARETQCPQCRTRYSDGFKGLRAT